MPQFKIQLNKVLFTVDPDNRFSSKKKVPLGLLTEMYFRYFVKEYTFKDLQDFYELKTKRNIDRKNLALWLKRVEVYKRAQMVLTMDQKPKECTVEYFGENADFVLKELESSVNR